MPKSHDESDYDVLESSLKMCPHDRFDVLKLLLQDERIRNNKRAVNKYFSDVLCLISQKGKLVTGEFIKNHENGFKRFMEVYVPLIEELGLEVTLERHYFFHACQLGCGDMFDFMIKRISEKEILKHNLPCILRTSAPVEFLKKLLNHPNLKKEVNSDDRKRMWNNILSRSLTDQLNQVESLNFLLILLDDGRVLSSPLSCLFILKYLGTNKLSLIEAFFTHRNVRLSANVLTEIMKEIFADVHVWKENARLLSKYVLKERRFDPNFENFIFFDMYLNNPYVIDLLVSHPNLDVSGLLISIINKNMGGNFFQKVLKKANPNGVEDILNNCLVKCIEKDNVEIINILIEDGRVDLMYKDDMFITEYLFGRISRAWEMIIVKRTQERFLKAITETHRWHPSTKRGKNALLVELLQLDVDFTENMDFLVADPVVDLSFSGYKAIRRSIESVTEFNYQEKNLVHVLCGYLQAMDYAFDDNYLIRAASEHNKKEILSILLSPLCIRKIDPAVCDNLPLRNCVKNAMLKSVATLIMDRRVAGKADFAKLLPLAVGSWKRVHDIGQHDEASDAEKIVKIFLKKIEEKEKVDDILESLIEEGNFELAKVFWEDLEVDEENKLLTDAIRNGSSSSIKFLKENVVERFRKECVVPMNDCINACVEEGVVDRVRDILSDEREKKMKKIKLDFSSFIIACEKGFTEVVRLLLEDGRIDPSTKECMALEVASECGSNGVVELLLKDPRVDVSMYSNLRSFHVAAENGNHEVIRTLLEDGRFDPSINHFYAFLVACENRQVEVLMELIMDHRAIPPEEEREGVIQEILSSGKGLNDMTNLKVVMIILCSKRPLIEVNLKKLLSLNTEKMGFEEIEKDMKEFSKYANSFQSIHEKEFKVIEEEVKTLNITSFFEDLTDLSKRMKESLVKVKELFGKVGTIRDNISRILARIEERRDYLRSFEITEIVTEGKNEILQELEEFRETAWILDYDCLKQFDDSSGIIDPHTLFNETLVEVFDNPESNEQKRVDEVMERVDFFSRNYYDRLLDAMYGLSNTIKRFHDGPLVSVHVMTSRMMKILEKSVKFCEFQSKVMEDNQGGIDVVDEDQLRMKKENYQLREKLEKEKTERKVRIDEYENMLDEEKLKSLQVKEESEERRAEFEKRIRKKREETAVLSQTIEMMNRKKKKLMGLRKSDLRIFRIPNSNLKFNTDEPEILGRGSFGAVFGGKETLERDVAVKHMIYGVGGNLNREEIFRELLSSIQFIHPNVIRTYGYTETLLGEGRGIQVGIVMERMQCSVRSLVDKNRMRLGEKYLLMFEMTKGLFFLHEREPVLLHRDIKGENFLCNFDEDLSDVTVKICDFGLVKNMDEGKKFTLSATGKGTTCWNAPETLETNAHYSVKSDVYSLGMTFWEVLFERTPFHEKNFNLVPGLIMSGKRPSVENLEGRTALPEEMVELLNWCWNQNPEDRPTTLELEIWFEEHEMDFEDEHGDKFFPK